MEPLEKGVSVRRWGQGRRRGGIEEEESRPVPLRGLAVNQKALFIAGEKDKDTQREKSKGLKKEAGETRILPIEQSQPQSRLASQLQLQSEYQRHG